MGIDIELDKEKFQYKLINHDINDKIESFYI